MWLPPLFQSSFNPQYLCDRCPRLLEPGARTGRGGAAGSVLTENATPAAASGGGLAARSANLTATAAGTGTGRGIGIRTETGKETESGHQKTKVRTVLDVL